MYRKKKVSYNILDALNNRSIGKPFKVWGKFRRGGRVGPSWTSKKRVQIRGVKRAIKKFKPLAARARVRVAQRNRRVVFRPRISSWRFSRRRR